MCANFTDKINPEPPSAGSGGHLSTVTTRLTDGAVRQGDSATEKFNDGREGAADGLEKAAAAVQTHVDQLPGGETVSDLAHAAADRLTSTADYVRKNDLKSMLANVEHVVRKNPGPALLAATLAGFFVGRALYTND